MKKQFRFLLSATMIASLMLSATACSKATADNKSSGTLGDATESSGASESTSENTADAKDNSSTADTSQADSANSESSDNTEDTASEQDSSASADSIKIPASEAELLEFMEGDWSLVNPVTKTDYATISFQNDGSFSYEYTDSGDKCEGSLGANHLYSGEDKLPLSFTINVSGLDKMNFDRDHYYVPEDGKDYGCSIKLLRSSLDELPDDLRTPEKVVEHYMTFYGYSTENGNPAEQYPFTVNGGYQGVYSETVNGDAIGRFASWQAGDALFLIWFSGTTAHEPVYQELIDSFELIKP